MKRVIWAKAAIDDLESIKTDLTEIYDGAFAQRTLNDLILAARWLAEHPRAGARLEFAEERKWKPRRTRYVLIYAPSADGIEVHRVRHERNDWRPVPE